MAMQSGLATIYTLNDSIEAELIKNLLTEHDVPCWLDGEHQAGFSGVFEIGVMVYTGDVERAKGILKRHDIGA